MQSRTLALGVASRKIKLGKETMTKTKDKVLSRYPHASAEYDSYFDMWTVYDTSEEERKRLDDVYWPHRHSRGVWGHGVTERKAWANAARAIEAREGRKLPPRDPSTVHSLYGCASG